MFQIAIKSYYYNKYLNIRQFNCFECHFEIFKKFPRFMKSNFSNEEILLNSSYAEYPNPNH
jgi:hypothetical protein